MRSLLTMIILSTILFMLMGCGFGSKPLEQFEVQKEYTIGGLFLGHAEVYSTSDRSEIKELHVAREKKSDLTLKMSEVEQELDILSHHDGEKPAVCSKCDENEQTVSTLKKSVEEASEIVADLSKIVRLDVTGISFEVIKDKTTGALQVKDITINTKQDEIIEDNIDTEDVDESEVKKYFGDLNEMEFNSDFEFDKKTGLFSFSLILVEDSESRIYSFKGETIEKFLNKKETKKEVTLKGEIEVNFPKGDDSEKIAIYELGTFSVSQTLDLKKEIDIDALQKK